MPRTARLCGHAGPPKCLERATTRGFCPEHAPVPFEAAKARWEAEKPKDYDKTRLRVIREARGLCELCGAKGEPVDHIIPVAEGGSWGRENLRLLCVPCHDVKTKEDARRGRQRHRLGRGRSRPTRR